MQRGEPLDPEGSRRSLGQAARTTFPPSMSSRSEQRDVAPIVSSGPPLHRGRCRSFCFLERESERWTVFLETFLDDGGRWRGRFTFRAADGRYTDAEIETADLFVEDTEAEVDLRARGLGRPLVRALLDSSIHTWERKRGATAEVGRTLRGVLARHSAALTSEIGLATTELTVAHLRSMYESYRIDQVVHLISLTNPDDFSALVARLLDGRPIDFHARDRLQLAMLVVQELERYLPLPPFEIWVEDFLAHRPTYQEYAFTLHRGGELPD